jgi:hypothetical protein
MTSSPITTPVSPDRVLAGALRLTLLPFARERAVGELVELANGEAAALLGALDRLDRERGRGAASTTAIATERLLRDAIDANTISASTADLALLAS